MNGTESTGNAKSFWLNLETPPPPAVKKIPPTIKKIGLAAQGAIPPKAPQLSGLKETKQAPTIPPKKIAISKTPGVNPIQKALPHLVGNLYHPPNKGSKIPHKTLGPIKRNDPVVNTIQQSEAEECLLELMVLENEIVCCCDKREFKKAAALAEKLDQEIALYESRFPGFPHKIDFLEICSYYDTKLAEEPKEVEKQKKEEKPFQPHPLKKMPLAGAIPPKAPQLIKETSKVPKSPPKKTLETRKMPGVNPKASPPFAGSKNPFKGSKVIPQKVHPPIKKKDQSVITIQQPVAENCLLELMALKNEFVNCCDKKEFQTAAELAEELDNEITLFESLFPHFPHKIDFLALCSYYDSKLAEEQKEIEKQKRIESILKKEADREKKVAEKAEMERLKNKHVKEKMAEADTSARDIEEKAEISQLCTDELENRSMNVLSWFLSLEREIPYNDILVYELVRYISFYNQEWERRNIPRGLSYFKLCEEQNVNRIIFDKQIEYIVSKTWNELGLNLEKSFLDKCILQSIETLKNTFKGKFLTEIKLQKLARKLKELIEKRDLKKEPSALKNHKTGQTAAYLQSRAYNPISYACKIKNYDSLQEAIFSGHKPDGDTLTLAMLSGRLDIISSVVNIDAKPNSETLNAACSTGQVVLVKIALMLGAKPNNKTFEYARKTKNQELIKVIQSFIK